MKTLLLLSLILAPSVILAKQSKNCKGPTLYRKVLSSENFFVSDTCTEESPLKLVNGPYFFPFGTYTANYWTGSYVRPAVNVTVMSYKWYDCYGNLLDQEVKKIKNNFNVFFDLENKNLGDHATWADIKAPMTDEEAKVAHQETLMKCKTATTDRFLNRRI